MPYVYLTLEQAIAVHAKTVEVSGGGLLGARELGLLDSVLTHIQNDDYYPTFAEKLTHLFYGACKSHAFLDGNKRIAISLCAQLLLLNGYLFCADTFIRAAENISYHVAADVISKDLLGEWIAAVLEGNGENEALKLKILNAMQEGRL